MMPTRRFLLLDLCRCGCYDCLSEINTEEAFTISFEHTFAVMPMVEDVSFATIPNITPFETMRRRLMC